MLVHDETDDGMSLLPCNSQMHRLAKPFVFIALWAVLLSPGICASVDRAEWIEEVELATGAIVRVKRTATRDSSGFPISPRGPLREWTIVFPDGRTTWKGNGQSLPIALEVAGEKMFVAINLQSRDLCKAYANPQSSVVFFFWDGAAWKKIEREEYPRNGRANLIKNPWGLDTSSDLRGLVKNRDKHLVRAYNNSVNESLQRVLADPAIDACEILKHK